MTQDSDTQAKEVFPALGICKAENRHNLKQNIYFSVPECPI